MELQTIFALILLAATLLIMASQKLRADLVALLVMLTLVVTGIVPPADAFAAFGQPVIIVVAGIYVIGAALFETGVATMIANQIVRYGGKGETTLMLIIMLVAALLTSVLGGLLVVALLMPAALRVARQTGIAPSRLLLPLATIATVGNQLTLIGTPSNVLVSDILAAAGHDSLGVFTLTPFGVASVAIVMIWYLLPGRRLLGKKISKQTVRPSLDEVEQDYRLDHVLFRLRVRTGSDLEGRPLHTSDLSSSFGLNLVAVRPKDGKLRPATPDWLLEQDDVLIVAGDPGQALQAANIHHLEFKGHVHLNAFNRLEQETLRLAEVIVPIRSALIGKTLANVDFRGRYGLNILAVQRRNKILQTNLPELRLEASDTLLVQGPIGRIRAVGKDLNLVFMTDLAPEPGELITRKAGTTLFILAAMLALVMPGILSLGTASFAAAIALVLTGCISLDRAYRSIDVKLIILIAGMLPLALALEQTGAAQWIADVILWVGQDVGAVGSLVILYLVAAVITQVISNSVVAALLMPVALSLAAALGVSPQPFAIAVAFAANAAYVTPWTDGDNLLVRRPGQYTTRDYVLNGLPIFLLQLAVLVSMLLLLQW